MTFRSMTPRRVASFLPAALQDELRRLRFLARSRKGSFSPNEPEAEVLDKFVSTGDWVIDVGANVGQYTLLLSRLVGASGRVIAIEPMMNSVITLASVAKFAEHRNITVLNVAASDRIGILPFDLPVDNAGLRNYERARVADNGGIPVFSTTIDALELPKRVAMVKIDAEGHELSVLLGMRQTLERDHPVLVVEESDESPFGFLLSLGYGARRIRESSPNRMYYHGTEHARIVNSI
jgi:FkbM family methyltransferase